MKQFFKKLWRGRLDEMQRLILLQAQRNAYLFLVLALLGWSLWESYGVYAWRRPLNLMPCLLLVGAALMQSFSQLALTRRAVKDDEDSNETGPLFALVLLACMAAGAVAAAGAALLLTGVRP